MVLNRVAHDAGVRLGQSDGRERGRFHADLVHARAVGAEGAACLAMAPRVGERGHEPEVRVLVVGVALQDAQQ